MRLLAAIYIGGSLLALWRADAAWPTRIALAVLWPLGPLAFVVTVAILLGASLIAFPLVAVVTAVVMASVWWALLR